MPAQVELNEGVNSLDRLLVLGAEGSQEGSVRFKNRRIALLRAGEFRERLAGAL